MVGGKKQVVVQASQVDFELPSISTPEIIGFSCRSMLINAHGVQRTLNRIGEHLIILYNDEELVIKAAVYFAVLDCHQYYTFVKGVLFESDSECTFIVEVLL